MKSKFNNRYNGKVVLVTGGASGIGRELCFQLADNYLKEHALKGII